MAHFLITDFNSQVLENISSNFKDEQVSTKYVSEQLPFDFQTMKYLSKKKKKNLNYLRGCLNLLTSQMKMVKKIALTKIQFLKKKKKINLVHCC